MIDFDKVSRARSLFKERGAIRREDIRDEIAYSWVRSRLYSKKKMIFKDSDTRIFISKIEYTPDQIIEFIYSKIDFDINKCNILVVGYDGKIKNVKYKNTLLGLKTPISFREEVIGTNGIGIAFSLKKNVVVYGSEHYCGDFDEFVTTSLVDIPFEIENGVLAILAKKEYFESELIDKIKLINYNLIENTQLEKKEKLNDPYNYQNEKVDYFEANIDNMMDLPYCLVGISKDKIKLKSLVLTRALSSSLINIYGDEVGCREYLARFIHENSPRKKLQFVRINPKIDIEYVMEKEIKEFQNGTLYIENFNMLSKSMLIEIKKISNCKLVNNKSCDDYKRTDVAIVISNEFEFEDKEVDSFVLTGLQLKIINIKSNKDDLKQLISKLIRGKLKLSKGIKNLEMFSPNFINEKSKEALEELMLIEILSYQNVEEELFKIVQITKDSIIVNRFKAVENTEFKFKNLSEIEIEYIKKVMDHVDGNVAKAAEILGIGRTTIYRKLKGR